MTQCFLIEPNGDALAVFPDGTEQIYSDKDRELIKDWKMWQPCYRRTDNGIIYKRWNDAPPGAMWYDEFEQWMHGIYLPGDDGKILHVKCPPGGRSWCIDARASNCTMKETDPDFTKHHCWVRHGVPPNITVDKNGVTCNAGAGSILHPKWHGHLVNRILKPC